MRTPFRLALGLAAALSATAQLGMFSREQRLDFTREWKGERFEDGRPRREARGGVVPGRCAPRPGRAGDFDGCARKYVALFNHQGASPITSLQYFASVVEEIAALDMPLNYWRYLAARVRKMENQWRAQAKFAPATPAATTETK